MESSWASQERRHESNCAGECCPRAVSYQQGAGVGLWAALGDWLKFWVKVRLGDGSDKMFSHTDLRHPIRGR